MRWKQRDQIGFGLRRGDQTALLLLFIANLAILLTAGALSLGPVIVITLLALVLRRIAEPVAEPSTGAAIAPRHAGNRRSVPRPRMVDLMAAVTRRDEKKPFRPYLPSVSAAWRLQALGYGLATVYALLLLSMYEAGGWLVATNGLPVYSDFAQQWIAATHAVHGTIAALYDPSRFVRLQAAVLGPQKFFYPHWPYPPVYLFLLTPFAELPYPFAFLSWIGITLLGCVAVVWLIVRRAPAIALLLGSPLTAWNIKAGQNGFLTASLLGAGLLLLERRPVLSGIFFGCLTCKPQFGVLIPVALAAARKWRAVASAAATGLVLAAASLVAFGRDAWEAFPQQLLRQADEAMVAGGHAFATPEMGIRYIQTVYGAVRGFGGSAEAAWILQGVASAAAGAIVWLVWRSHARYGLKAAVVSAAIFLATPCAYAYDLAALAIPAAFLCADQMRCGLERHELAVLLALFGLAIIILVSYGSLPLGPVIVVSLLGLMLRRIRSQDFASSTPSAPAVPAGGTGVSAGPDNG